MGGKRGVIAAAMVGVKGQADIQYMGFPEGIGGIWPQQGENVFSC